MSEIVIYHLFFTIFSLSLLSIPWASSSGLTLKLIHRDSPLSPLYQPNLSDSERFMINLNISEARASYFQQQSTEVKDALFLRLPLKLTSLIYTVEIGIGTPAVKRTLAFDTGSSLTWIQCKPCPKCFKQNEPLFDPKTSISYKPINKINHHLARFFTCSAFFGTSKGCTYNMKYVTGQTSTGVAAAETFTFLPNSATVSNIAFGCGTSSSGNFPSVISGRLGLDRGPVSLARQLVVSKGRFSYCLANTKASYLRFGDEAKIRGRNVQRTLFLNHKIMIYAVRLIDLSVNGQKLGLDPAAFPNGCFIDSGAAVSMLNKRAFAAARGVLEKYFAQFRNVRRYAGNKVAKGALCYTELDKGFSKFPSFKFHFQGADLNVPADNLFSYIEDHVFCLAIKESRGITVLGVQQQRNVRMVYDLNAMMLSFAPEDCSKDS